MDNQQPGSQDPNTMPVNPGQAPVPTPAPVEPAPQAVPVQPATPQTFAPQPEPTTTFQPTMPAQPMQPAMPIAQPYSPQPMAGQQPQVAKDPGHGMGIASLVTSLLGLGLVGVILGFIAMSKSKKAGLKGNTLGLVGVIIGFLNILVSIVLIGLVLVSFQGTQSKARDMASISNLNAVHSKLEEFYNNSGFYPEEMLASNFPGLDSEALKSGSQTPIVVIKGSSTEADALAQAEPSANEPYQYIPINCTNGECSGYVLRVQIDYPSSVFPNPYTKRGLFN